MFLCLNYRNLGTFAFIFLTFWGSWSKSGTNSSRTKRLFDRQRKGTFAQHTFTAQYWVEKLPVVWMRIGDFRAGIFREYFFFVAWIEYLPENFDNLAVEFVRYLLFHVGKMKKRRILVRVILRGVWHRGGAGFCEGERLCFTLTGICVYRLKQQITEAYKLVVENLWSKLSKRKFEWRVLVALWKVAKRSLNVIN